MNKHPETIYALHADVLRVLAQPRRLMILDCLRDGEKSVGELAELLKIPQPNVSQHLAALRSQEIVVTRREGNTIFYSLADARLIQACELCRQFLAGRLKSNGALADQFESIRPAHAAQPAVAP